MNNNVPTPADNGVRPMERTKEKGSDLPQPPPPANWPDKIDHGTIRRESDAAFREVDGKKTRK